MAEACATSGANNLASKLGEYLIAHIGRQFEYVLCYKSYVKELKNGVEKLETMRGRVQRLVDEAKYDGKPIHADIKNWLGSVENKAKEAENLLKQGETANISCFRGWLPNPVVRHPIGRKLKKMTRLIQELHNESSKNIFQKVYHENTPIGIVTAITSGARSVDNKEDILESRALIIDDVMKAIVDDKVCVIGVHGPGGVGKSKLLDDIERRIKEERKFDVVAKANVSRNPDIKRIQGEIAYALGLKLMNEETARGRADMLYKRIESDSNKNILIILDNLWKKLDLNEVGIPCGYDNKVRGCKLLLTSRYRDVLCIDMGSDQEFQLNILKDREARRLFESIVGDKVRDPEFKHSVDGVVKNCDGLPLLIVSLAKRLKHGDLPAWRNALAKIEGSDIKSIVELNYNDLKDDKIRLLFLVCALICGIIDISDALVYCMGLGLYKEFGNTIENARDRLMLDLHNLQDSSLLLDSDDMEIFRMHDIYVDVAISIASTTEWRTFVWRKDYGFKEWSNNELRKCTMISFFSVGIDELPEKLDCPNLRVLVLQHNRSLKIPESFFESTKKLQVLDFTGLSFTCLPASIGFLENLKSLCLYWCHLEDVTVLKKLKGLQFLILKGSTITWLPKEIGELTELRYLDLTMCTRLNVIEPGVLGSLVYLEELYMEDSFDHWEAEDESPRSNASLVELMNMKKLTTLYIAIPHFAILSRDLPFGKLNKHKIQIGDVWDWSDEYKVSRTLKLKLNSSNLLHEEWLRSCLQITEDLHLDGLQYGSDSIHNLCIEGFQELKHLHVRNSPSIAYVVHSIPNVQCITFTRLESLFLENLGHLEKICRGYLAPESFSNLKTVKVDNCGEIKHLFPSTLTRVFLQLKEIEIKTCHLMQHIIVDSEADEVEDEIDDDPKVKSCDLQVFFPSLEELTLLSLCGLRRIWSSDLPEESFSRLASITVGDCENLAHIFPTTLIEMFKSLKTIEVFKCASLEALVEHVAVDPKKRQKSLVLLVKEVKLWHLSRLNALVRSSIKATLSLPSLTNLSLRTCHGLRYLFTDDTARTLEKLEMLDVSDCDNMQEVVAVEEGEEQKLKAVNFSHLRTLKLCFLKSLISISPRSCACEFPSLKEFTVEECKAVVVIVGDASCKKLKDNIPTQQPLLLVEKVEFPNMESMKISHMDNVEKIWIDELVSNAFRNLKTLIVEHCEKLSSIFSSETILARFRNLEKLVVTGCDSLEVVFHIQELNMSEAHLASTFQLRELNLERLPKMKHVWSGHPRGTITFEYLQCLHVDKCESLQSLFPSSVAKSMAQLEELVICDGGVEEIIAEEDREVGTSASDLFFQD
ncbi:probable disease resistance protein At4g27220 [Eucalyptus grandis]|uniref:probable disease resistance protein At4g27220 n=1 Tax=Eucalyptus grandis TaxID=71139 RepID=UPI00192E8D8F|nr:probable disease resistance protein At4g27220 [Eucalyptus grandis]